MDLSSMIENSIKEETTDVNFIEQNDDDKINMTSPDIDHVEMIKEDENIMVSDNNVEPASLIEDIVDFKKHIGDNIDRLQYTKYINIASDDISNDDGIVILKSIEDDKNIIQLYKDMNNYNIFNNEIDYMKLCGENGFMIKYQSDHNYHWKLYGTKSSMCVTLFIEIGDKQYPLYFEKFAKTKFSKLEWPDGFHLTTVEEYTNQLRDNNSFDVEDCCIYYPPLFKKADELTSKQLVLDKLHDILIKTYDIAHCIKLINAMVHII